MQDTSRKAPSERKRGESEYFVRWNRLTATGSGHALAQLFMLLLALIVGYCINAASTQFASSGSWNTVFLSMAALCLGFGASALLFHRLQDRQSDSLRHEYDALRARADALVEEVDRYERDRPR